MNEIDKLAENLKRNTDGASVAQIRFVECASVDWQHKTMDAKSGEDDEYLGVSLSLGSVSVKPAIGSVCLIGLVDAQEVVTFLISAESVELVEINAEQIIYNAGEIGLAKADKITEKLNTLETELSNLKALFLAWTPVVNDGGMALKSAISTWAGNGITLTVLSEIEDEKIKHG